MTTPITPASPPELCPVASFCPYCGLYDCRTKRLSDEVTRLRLELSKAQGALHEAWKDGMGVGYKAGKEPLWIPQPNPFPKPEKKESE